MSFPPHDPTENAQLLVRARALRQHARDVLQRAVTLRRRATTLLAASGNLRLRMEIKRTESRGPLPDGTDPPHPDDVAEVAEEQAWVRAQVRQMLGSGWTRDEMADIGIRDALLRELGLQWPAEAA